MSAEPLVSIDRTGGSVQPAAKTMLDELWAYVDEEVELKPVTLQVPLRPKASVRFATDIDYELWKAWNKAATSKTRGREEVDFQKLAVTVLVNKCEAILFDGAEVSVDGQPLTFASPEFRERFGGGSIGDALVGFYVRDTHVRSTADEIVQAAGFFDEVHEADTDPT